MRKVFIYWDNSNIFVSAQNIANKREGALARSRVRIHFENIYRLAHCDREVAKALAVGSIPPDMQYLWNKLEAQGLEVELYDRGDATRGEQNMPDKILQLSMLEDGFDNNGKPQTVVLLTGDGAGYSEGKGFHSTLERLHNRGWNIEIMSWAGVCNSRMRRWAEEKGIFVPLDDYYESITYVDPVMIMGNEYDRGREATELDLTNRPISED